MSDLDDEWENFLNDEDDIEQVKPNNNQYVVYCKNNSKENIFVLFIILLYRKMIKLNYQLKNLFQ